MGVRTPSIHGILRLQSWRFFGVSVHDSMDYFGFRARTAWFHYVDDLRSAEQNHYLIHGISFKMP